MGVWLVGWWLNYNKYIIIEDDDKKYLREDFDFAENIKLNM